ncbi:hypothetical protein IFM89_026519 [Coptis chinensis]|uniref:DUF4283 domain-containing protein n=1 Tax=Coptis chinensis TaxID=261450 RepID=A0A835HFP5_9MAGN|nr:hypothetical protein IFM89_026519 [Coptis chinensis]
MNEDIESAHPMDKKGKQYVLPNIEYQQVRKWVLTHSPENAEWEESWTSFRASAKDRNLVDDEVTYYGVVKRILELDYVEFKQTVFSCDWGAIEDKTNGKRSHVEASEASGFEANESEASEDDDKNKSPRRRTIPYIAVKLLILKKCQPTGEHLSKSSFASIPIWVKFYNVPLGSWTPEGMEYLGSNIGNPSTWIVPPDYNEGL